MTIYSSTLVKTKSTSNEMNNGNGSRLINQQNSRFRGKVPQSENNDESNNINDDLNHDNSFIVTDNLNEEVLDRPDVPNWFKEEILQNESTNDLIKKKNIVENESMIINSKIVEQQSQPYKVQIVWRNIFTMSIIHLLAIYGFYLGIRFGKFQSLIWAYFIGQFGGYGVLAGAHRLWTHRAYKAHWLFRLILMIGQTIALQNDIYEWARDHRVHHKFSETDADPHNSKRGFFFAHCGWLLCRKHPQVKIKGSQIDLSDLWDDPIVRFQRRFYIPLIIIFWGILPIWIPVYFWGEAFWIAFTGNFLRYVISLHHAWLVNSAAHMYGQRYYDKNIEPRENRFVVYMSLGEGYHNYHHTFPWDYSASEHGWRKNFNLATFFIDVGAKLGLVWDRRVVSRAVVEKRALRTGDLSIIPPFISKERKPVSLFIDIFLGIVVNSWLLWISFILMKFFHV